MQKATERVEAVPRNLSTAWRNPGVAIHSLNAQLTVELIYMYIIRWPYWFWLQSLFCIRFRTDYEEMTKVSLTGLTEKPRGWVSSLIRSLQDIRYFDKQVLQKRRRVLHRIFHWFRFLFVYDLNLQGRGGQDFYLGFAPAVQHMHKFLPVKMLRPCQHKK